MHRFKDGQVITQGDDVPGDNTAYSKKTVNEEDSGVYQCRAVNQVMKKLSQPAKIIVKGKSWNYILYPWYLELSAKESQINGVQTSKTAIADKTLHILKYLLSMKLFWGKQN